MTTRQPLIPPVGGERKKYPPHPRGQFIATCIDVIDRGMVKTVWEGQERMTHKVTLRFWAGKWRQDEETGEQFPWLIDAWFTFSLNEKAKLRKFLEQWSGEVMTTREAATYDLWKCMDRTALLQVIHSENGEYANINAVMAAPEGQAGPGRPQGYIPVADRPPRDDQLQPGRDSYGRPAAPAPAAARPNDDELPF